MDSKLPLFSVIVPVFNAGKFLDRGITSVLGQTLPDFELILVDDGSTDDAIERAQLKTDRRLTILRQSNAGAPAALNRGLAAARGEYVAFLDSDDFWAPDKLEQHLECFRAHPEVDLTFTGLVYVDADDKPLNLPQRRPAGYFTFEQLFVDYRIGCSSAMAVRKQALHAAGGFDPAMLYLFDIDLALRIARLRRNNAVGISEPLTFYRRRPGQQTSDWRIMALYWTKLLEKQKTLNTETLPLMQRANSNMYRYFSYLSYEQRDFRTSSSLLGQAFGIAPLQFLTDLRNWKLGLACCCASILPQRLHQWLETQANLRFFETETPGRLARFSSKLAPPQNPE